MTKRTADSDRGSSPTKPRPNGEALNGSREPRSHKEWQEYVNRLASLDANYRGATYQPVPDETQGDGGLEGYTTDGHAFQAYCPEATKGRELKKALCKKITDDLNKLDRYRDYWTKTLGRISIHTWHLVVPRCSDKSVLTHAATRAAALLDKQLDFITDDFCALVRQPKDFSPAYQALQGDGLEHVRIPERQISDAEFRAFEKQSAEKIQSLDRKLRHLPRLQNQARLEEGRSTLLQHYLEYKNGLSWMERRFPESFERLITRQQNLRADIETKSLVTPQLPPKLLENTRKELEKEFTEVASFLPSDQRLRMSWGLVVEWLLECPLEFYDE